MARVHFQIEIPVTPRWHDIELLRASVLSCLATMFRDSAYCHAVGMITSELLENAVKYGDWKADRQSFRLRVAGDPTVVEVEVSNPVASASSEVEELLRTVRFLDARDDPEAAYLERLKAVAAQADGDGRSRLGLCRIVYEGQCRLAAAVDDGVLHVRAVSHPLPEASWTA